ncbi:hypothetical protein A2U01_0078207, partial [Trifolium medium]|nr:hypothetical protein [Trifolium medium]
MDVLCKWRVAPEGWRVAPVTNSYLRNGSDFSALRRFIWRVAQFHEFILCVAQEVGRVAL